MVAVGAQNSGQNSYRIRQPFDFSGRTGKIVLDADATVEERLIGWVSVQVTEDPVNAPTFVLDSQNDEDASIPRNGLEVQLGDDCLQAGSRVGLRGVLVYDNYKLTGFFPPDHGVCVATQRDHLNHFEVRVSQQNVEVWGAPYSADGHATTTAVLMYSTPIKLPFSRGYVSITTHNHASKKYSPNNAMDAWVTRWDNVGFDGPVIGNWREYEVADSLLPGKTFDGVSVTSVGYRVADAATGPAQTLRLHNVDIANAVSARLSVSAWYLTDTGFGAIPTKFVLRYRFNGKAWHDRMLTTEEIAVLADKSNGQIGQMLDVPLADLVQGENTLEFVTLNVPQSYPPLVQNIDLVLVTH
jgi:hypothetical protein